MDLTNIWQEHRTFILLVMAGLLVFFVGQGVISSVYGIDETKLSSSTPGIAPTSSRQRWASSVTLMSRSRNVTTSS